MFLLSTGLIKFANEVDHPVTARVLPALSDYDEHDILKNDEEIMQSTKNQKICHSTVLLGLVASSSIATKTVLAASLVHAAAAMDMQNDMEPIQEKTYIGIYIMIFLTVVIAVNMDKMMKYILEKINRAPSALIMVKEEVKEETNTAMEVDHTGPPDDALEVWRLKKRIRIEQEEQEDLKITIKVREDALENMQERLEEKTREAEKWREFGEQVCFDRDNQKQLKEERTERIDELEQQVDDLVAEKETLQTELNKAKAKINNVIGENRMKEGVIASSAKHIQKLRDDLKEEREKQGRGLFSAPAQPAQAAAAALDVEKEHLKAKVAQLEQDAARLREIQGQYGQEIQALRNQLRDAKAPAKISVTRSGSCYHEASCNHLMHGVEQRPRVEYTRCKDCW